MTKQKIMEIPDPNEALIEMLLLTEKEQIDLETLENWMTEYEQKHNLENGNLDMAFFPDGEQVVTSERFEQRRKQILS